MAPKIEMRRAEVKNLTDQLFRLQRTPSYIHSLVAMLESLRQFQDTCEVCTHTYFNISKVHVHVVLYYVLLTLSSEI